MNQVILNDKNHAAMRTNFLMKRQQVGEECQGCENVEMVESDSFCKCYMFPHVMWKNEQQCIKFHDPNKAIEEAKKKFVNPLKWSKRKSRR